MSKFIDKLPTAEELMVPLVLFPQLDKNETIEKAIYVLNNYTFDFKGKTALSRAILVTDNYSLIGLIQRRDIFKGLGWEDYFGIPSDLTINRDYLFDENIIELFNEKLLIESKIFLQEPIEKIYVKIDGIVNYNDHLFKIIHNLKDYRILPVKKEDKIIGIIRANDVMFILEEILEVKKYDIKR